MKKIYDAIAYGQTLHPDEDILGSEEETEDEERLNYDTIQDGTESQQLLGRQLFSYYRSKPKCGKGLEKYQKRRDQQVFHTICGIRNIDVGPKTLGIIMGA